MNGRHAIKTSIQPLSQQTKDQHVIAGSFCAYLIVSFRATFESIYTIQQWKLWYHV